MKIRNFLQQFQNKQFLKFVMPITISAICGVVGALLLAFSPAMENSRCTFQNYKNASQSTETETDITVEPQESKVIVAGEKALQNSEIYGQGGFETPAQNQESMASSIEETDAALLADAEMNESLNDKNYPSLSYHVYRIKKGDMLGTIAENFGVTEDTLISVNNIKQSRYIQIGQYIKIPSIAGILYTVRKTGETAKSIAEKYEVNDEKVTSVNNLKTNEVLKEGSIVFVPDAFLDWITRQEINGDLFQKPVHCWYYCSSPYGWRNSPFTGSRSFHGGVDMACNLGTHIYAALAGTVTTAGWSNVYGNYVIITHHSGYKTLYGHMSKIIATQGQWVSVNTCIGYVGTTGMSTGPHLHFSVYKNGVSINPENLWK
jgi:murein DD-endopeptidase MepM/ murein hydrolase activator NlpD